MSKMNKLLRTLIAVGVLAGSMAPAHATDLKVSLYWGPKSPIVIGGYKPFVESLEADKASDLKVRMFTGGALLDAKATLPGLRSGIADVGTLAMTYFPAELPASQLVADLAMMGSDSVAAAAAVTEYMLMHCEPCRNDWQKMGLVLTSAYSTTPYLIISKTRVETVDDLKGKKIRSPGGVWDRWVESVGAVPVNVSSSEMYEAFNRGVVDMVIHTPAALKSVNLGDFAKYVVKVPLGTYHALSAGTYNAKTWKGLSDAQRKAIFERLSILVVGISDQYRVQDVEAEEIYGKKGVSISAPSAALKQQVAEFRKADMASIVADAKGKYGIANPEAEIATMEKLFAKWDQLIAPVAGDRARMQAIVRSEIYDKLDPTTFGM